VPVAVALTAQAGGSGWQRGPFRVPLQYPTSTTISTEGANTFFWKPGLSHCGTFVVGDKANPTKKLAHTTTARVNIHGQVKLGPVSRSNRAVVRLCAPYVLASSSRSRMNSHDRGSNLGAQACSSQVSREIRKSNKIPKPKEKPFGPWPSLPSAVNINRGRQVSCWVTFFTGVVKNTVVKSTHF
jgi:hypothetical protein